jgi:hypothetical protein
MNTYIFVNGKIKKATLEEWMIWFANPEKRRIDLTDISNEPNYPNGEQVSTVFLGLDHGFNFDSCIKHLPILFETMVFGGKYSRKGWQYSSCGEAKNGHWQIVDCIKNGQPPFVPFGEKPAMELFLEMFEDEEENEY